MLPKRDGLSVIEEIRRKGNMVPVLILSALDDVDERVTGLKAGGDDYLTKPYSLSELSARLQALTRRAQTTGVQGTVLHVGDLTSRVNFDCWNTSCNIPVKWLLAACCLRMYGIITSIRKPTSSMSRSAAYAARSTRTSPHRCCTPFEVLATSFKKWPTA